MKTNNTKLDQQQLLQKFGKLVARQILIQRNLEHSITLHEDELASIIAASVAAFAHAG
jgi:uncharacterized protein YqgQ